MNLSTISNGRDVVKDYNEYEKILIFKWLQLIQYNYRIYNIDNKHR